MTRTEDRTATVVGAGVGGLAVALALSRAGWGVDVQERATVLDGGGAGLVLAPNAVRALRALGVADEVVAGATVLQGTGVRTAAGRWLSRVRSDDVASLFAAPALGVVRSRLVDVLAGAVGRDSVRLAQDVHDPGRLRADLVVGADGIGSVVRRTWWPDAVVRYAGYTAWRALVPAACSTLGSGPAVATETWGRGERFGVVPVGRGQVYVYATARVPAGERVGDEVAELRRRFGRWHAPIPALLEALSGATVLRHDVHALALPAALHRAGPPAAVLVGDAGHAMEPNLGQGAGTALEDAVELAHWLRGEASMAQALTGYSRSRVPRVAALARRSRQVGRVAQVRHPVLAAARDAAVALTPERIGRAAAAALTDWHPPGPPVRPWVQPST